MFLYSVQREYFTFSLSNQLLYCIVLVSISSISTSVMLQGVEPHVILAGGGGGCGKRVVSLSLFIPAGHHTLVRLLSTQLALLQSVVVFFLFLDVGVGCRLDSPSKPPRKHRRTAMGAESSAQRDVTASEEEKDASAAEGGCVLDSKVRHASLFFVFFSSFKPHFKSSLFLKPMSGMCLLELWRSFIIYFFAESCWWRTDKNRFRTQQVSGAAPIFKLFAVCEINVPS